MSAQAQFCEVPNATQRAAAAACDEAKSEDGNIQGLGFRV